MNRRTHLSMLVGSLAGAAFCNPAQAETESLTKIAAGPFQITASKDWATGAIAEKVAALPLYSPDAWKRVQEDPLIQFKPFYGNRPQHWAIRFPSLVLKGETFDTKEAGSDRLAPQLLIHKTDDWSKIFEDGVYLPEEAKAVRQKLRQDMQAMANEKRIINPAFMNASPWITILQKKLSFKGGYGYRFITQWGFEVELLNKGSLHYQFIGLSDDDSCQIIATFPIDHPQLPDTDNENATHLGYSGKHYEELLKNYDDYSAKAQSWVADRASEFSPSIEKLDQLIESLHAETWPK